MNTTLEPLKEVMHARSILRWMKTGVMPSPDNVARAEKAVKALATSGLVDEDQIKATVRITSAMSMGVVPSVEKCTEACATVDQLIAGLRERSAETVRNDVRHRG